MTTESTPSEQEALENFLDQLREILEEVVAGSEYTDWFPQELYRPLQNAWSDLKESDRFEEVKRELRDVAEGELRKRGLKDPQLRLKTQLFAAVLSAFRQSDEEGDENEKRRKKKGWFRRLLDAANILLKSIAAVVGAAEGIDEFKEAVKGLIALRDAQEEET